MGVQGEFFRSPRYPTHPGRSREKEGIAASGERSPGVCHARFRHRLAISSGVAGTNLRRTARYAWENCDPLHDSYSHQSIAKLVDLKKIVEGGTKLWIDQQLALLITLAPLI